MKNKTILLYAALIIVVFGGIFALRAVSEPGQSALNDAEPRPLDGFAQCIADSGAKFYGAFWCPHCESQRDMFGNSKRLLPYIECSTPNAQAQTAACLRAGVESYPTWDLADGTRITGVQSFENLAEMTNCQLPADA